MTSNFLQFDPNLSNIMNDGDYSSDTYRQNGVVGGIADSALHNKLYYQTSTMAAALGTTLSDLGQTITDTNVSGLIASLKAAFSLAGVNAQTGTTYTVQASDRGKLITFSNASSVAVTLPQANTAGFDESFYCEFANIGAGVVTITPTTSTINGRANVTLFNGCGFSVLSNGTNYFSPISRVQDPRNAVKALASVGVSGGIATLKAGSFNVSSVSRSGAGLYTVNFTTAFADTNYLALPVCRSTGGGNNLIGMGPTASKLVGACGLSAVQLTSNTDIDFDVIFLGIQ
jgi:hypothetical protein